MFGHSTLSRRVLDGHQFLKLSDAGSLLFRIIAAVKLLHHYERIFQEIGDITEGLVFKSGNDDVAGLFLVHLRHVCRRGGILVCGKSGLLQTFHADFGMGTDTIECFVRLFRERVDPSYV